jgi:parallel beta-helix repeat protein
MKSNTKSKIIVLICFGILFAIVLMITVNPSNSKVITFDKEKLKISAVSGKIHIDDDNPSINWTVAKKDGICTGNGTYSDPYIIEYLEIDGEGSGSCILIENSEVYFRIEDCSLYNAEWGSDAGINLLNVNNSQLIGNDCSYSQLGIVLGDGWGGGGCYNNTITGNIVNNNRGGIYLFDSYNNTISSNTANNNTWSGIYLIGSNYTIVSGNTMNDNKMCGINIGGGHNNVIVSGNIISDNHMQGLWMDESFNNTISGNILNNNNFSGICLIDSNYNIISGNTAIYNKECGIILFQGIYNTISGNTANYNQWGIFLYNTGYNIVSGNNLIGNDECIVEVNCQGNVIQDNDCSDREIKYLPIILIISTAIIGVSAFMVYKNRKLFKKPQEDLDFL